MLAICAAEILLQPQRPPSGAIITPPRRHNHYTGSMLSNDARARLSIVLVGARNPSNIGAAARAMRDFGFSDLRIVNAFAAPFEAAQLEAEQAEAAQLDAADATIDAAPPKSAVAAHSVMRSALRFDTLAPAIADCSLVVATTAVGDRRLSHPVLSLQQAAPRILQTLVNYASAAPTAPSSPLPPGDSDQPEIHSGGAQQRVALLFGSEKTGLTKDQLSHANLLTTIPMFAPDAARHLSMNLGQSVAVCLYELTREGFEDSNELPQLHEAAATAEDRERLTHLLLDVLHATGYTRRFPANSAEPLIRQLAQHMGHNHREAMTLMGILRQILWHERNHTGDPLE